MGLRRNAAVRSHTNNLYHMIRTQMRRGHNKSSLSMEPDLKTMKNKQGNKDANRYYLTTLTVLTILKDMSLAFSAL